MKLGKFSLIFYCLFLSACDTHSDKIQGDTMSSNFYVKAGISPDEYNQKNQLHPKKSVDKQPAGLNFYKQRWNNLQLGNVHIENDRFSFEVPHVMSLTGVADVEYLERGIDEFTVRSGINPDEFIGHDQARIQFMKILKNLLELGWQSYIEFHADPRLSAKESFTYAIEDGAYAPDPSYVPTLDEWMALGSGQGWVFYADNVFMEVMFRRNSQHMDKNGEGVYLLTHTILTKDARVRNYFQGKEREQWETLWVESIKKDKIMRYEEEVNLIKQGYYINTQYVEPKFHPSDPVEPEKTDEVKALLDYIEENNH
jgi:hypothetical protein